MAIIYSSVLFTFAALVFTSDFVAILTYGQTMSEKWAFADDPITTFNAQTNTFTMKFDVDDSVTQANVAATIWEKGCMEEGNQLIAVDGIEGITTAVDTLGEGSLAFAINTETLVQNSNVFTALLTENSAEMKICTRFMLQTDDGSFEVNFIETIITIIFDLTAGFEVEGFAVTVVEKNDPSAATFLEAYNVVAYLCNPAVPSEELTALTFNQGSVISVCLSPTVEALADGLLIETIDSFNWVRGFIEQPAIENSVQAANQLTNFVCAPGSIYCAFSSILYAEFYQPTAAPSSSPTVAPSSSPTVAATQTNYPYTTVAATQTIYPTVLATICEGVNQTTETALDFNSATVKRSDAQSGGELRFGDIGTINGEVVDLLITSTDYYHPDSEKNGKDPSGKFGEITVKTVKGDPDSGKGTFDFCLVLDNTYTPIMAKSFQWSVFDLDIRAKSPSIHEKMSIDTSQFAGYSLYPNADNTELGISCENDGSAPPCDEGVRTIFAGTTTGGGSDNPTDPNNLTEQQKKRSVVFTFTDTSCWTMEFNAYCPYEPEQSCGSYGGSKLLFGGGASQVVSQGSTECSDEQEEQLNDVGETESARTLRHLGAPRRNLGSSAEVGGIGQATLMFVGARRLSKNGRDLQGEAGPQANIELSIDIEIGDDEYNVVPTAGGRSSVWSSLLFFILGLLVNAAFLLA